ncbi:hypothetical protein [Sulfurihydrogenibium sp.]|uniref:hypothetical protein n=1 Tax=Sulfurihydrogenibium sp. TaxID=2053621 RepID=UPI002607A329|nr:hypothetical protein [Sulfurihydrogenibium sp.]
MDIDKIVEKLKEAITGEIKTEFSLFKAEVSGQLKGFALAIENMNVRLSNVESDLRHIREELKETNKRIDDVRTELTARIDETNKRIDETNKRIDDIRAELTARIDETNKRIDETNKRIDETNKRIDETNKRIDDVKAELTARIDETNKRIDFTNQRIDNVMYQLTDIRADLKEALELKRFTEDAILRIERLEAKVFTV